MSYARVRCPREVEARAPANKAATRAFRRVPAKSEKKEAWIVREESVEEWEGPREVPRWLLVGTGGVVGMDGKVKEKGSRNDDDDDDDEDNDEDEDEDDGVYIRGRMVEFEGGGR